MREWFTAVSSYVRLFREECKMQKDSMHMSTSGQMTHNQAVTQESQVNSFHCTHCTLIFKSKIYLFEHLNKVHGIDVDLALIDAGLKSSRTFKANTDSYGNTTGNPFECQNCAFKACSQELLNKHEKQCPNNSNTNLIISENPETKITVISTNKHEEAAGAEEIMSTSKTKCTVNLPKDLKTYKRPLQTITKYFAPSSGSNGKPPVKVVDSSMPLDSTEGTLILQESPSITSPNSGVFKVTAKPTIDIAKRGSDNFLLNERLLISELKPQEAKEQVKETVQNNAGKRTSKESLKGHPTKKAKSDKEETKLPAKSNKSKHQSSNNPEFSFEVSEDEEEKRIKLVNGDRESPGVYFCKHCNYCNVAIGHVSTHYQTNHPYIKHNTAYIQDPNDQSATFRCLECPVEFQSVAGLKSHYTENHPEAPDVFTMQSHEFHLVFKCFVCSFNTKSLKALKEHCKEKHATHKVENSLMYCRYSATSSQEGSSRLNTCEKAPSPERPGRISPDGARTPSKEIKNATSCQHPTSKGADVALYHCKTCKFSHKSVVVMHVHYQKNHPDEAVTIDKIKQSARVMSQTTSQVTPDKSPKSVAITEKSTPQKNITESQMKTRNTVELSQQKKISLFLINPKHTAEASKIHSESSETENVESDRSKRRKSPTKPDREMSNGMDSLPSSSPNKLFYCQCCSYSSTNVRSVVSHHNVKHVDRELTCIEDVLRYNTELKEKKLDSDEEASATTTPSESKSRKQVEACSENKLLHREDDAAGASVKNVNAYQCAENLFYCQTCNFGTLSVKGILNHQHKVHQSVHYSKERIVEYTALIRGEIEKSKSQAKELSFSTHLPLPLVNEYDENMFFCHFCNYRQGTVDQVLRHYSKRHRGFVVKGKQVRLYSDMVLKQTRKSHLKTTANQEISRASTEEKGNKKSKNKKLGKVTAPPSTRESPSTKTQRALQCYKCPYSTQYVYLLKRHIWKIHKIKRSVTAVLKVCYKQGTLQPGYHCDLCVFSHKKAEAVYKHYQEHHTGRSPSLEYVTSLLYVGPKTLPHKRKKPQIRHADGDGSVSSQRCGKSETKTYSCRACSFKGSSMASIMHHYHAVHPWSVKEDGSVLDVINRKKLSANRQVEDHNEMSASFNTYQMPVEENTPGSSHEATVFTKMLKCPHCPEKFYTQHGVKVHCGIKHPEAVMENIDEPQEQQSTSKTRVHVFKCPHCAYVNTIYQGVLTHCQMKHPTLAARADSLHVDDAHVDDMKVRKGLGSKFSGYMCKTCPQICATLEKLNKHCEEHSETVTNTPWQAPKPSAVSKIKQSKTHGNRGSVSKASFLSKKVYAVVRCPQCSYTCSSKIALDRHSRLHHKNAPVLKVQDCVHKCFLCSISYFRKDSLRSHYTRKHGKEAYLKYFVPTYKKACKKAAPKSPHKPLTSMTTEKNKIVVYKCPRCPYVNSSLHGILTHCQMRHPAFVARADKLKKDEILLTNMVGCTMGKGSNERGFTCKKCPEIHRSLKKLKIHLEKDHKKAKKRASEQSAEIETEKQTDHSFQVSVLEAFALKNKTSAVSAAEIDLDHQLGAPETYQPNTPSVKYQQSVYKCHICTYKGLRRRYLLCHYKRTHKFDAFTTFKLLERYNKRKHNKTSNPPEADSEESTPVKCKMCPNLMFDSSQLLIAHYSTFHISERMLDFIVLSQGSKRSTGLYKCALCNKQMNGTRKLCYHLDGHREREMRKEQASLAITTTPEARSMEVCRQDKLPTLETVEELAQWNVTPAETFTLPASPLPSPSKPCDLEQPEPESREDKNTCKRCGRKFMSLKGLRSHERSHAAVAAIKKLDNLPTSALKHYINKYVIYKSGTTRPFLCRICSYRTTVMGLWSSHFVKNHQDVLVDPPETDNQDEQRAQMDDDEPPNSSEELNHVPELDEEPEITEKSSYLEPPDVQRQLNHYNLMARAGAQSKASTQETSLPENSLLHCEVCNFNTGHLSSMRRHYLNRHGKKILRCKDCSFFTWLRRTMEMHMETGHSSCQSEPTHQKDLCCPFCIYHTKNKNNMIDHIVLHREERVVPIEVRRPKLSRYLEGIVFRCHQCTFTCGSAEILSAHMMRHDDIKPYRCRLCYFDCTRLSDLEAHLSDKHQVLRNHELVGQVSLDQLEARVGRMHEEDPSDSEDDDLKTDELIMDCDEIPRETTAEPAEHNIEEKITPQIKEAHQEQGQDIKNGNQESPARSPVLQLQYENGKPNTTVHEQNPQEQAGNDTAGSDTARGQGIENIVEQNVGEGNSVEMQLESCNGPEKERQTNENQAQRQLGDSEDGSITFTQQEEAEGSSTMYDKAKSNMVHIKAHHHRTLNIEARVEESVLGHMLLLDVDGSSRKIHNEADQDITVKMEQNSDHVLHVTPLRDKDGSITFVHNRKNQVNTETSASEETNYAHPVERHLLTLELNCEQLKISQKETMGVSVTNCKKELANNPENSEEVTDSYWDMPVLENEYLKEEMPPFGCCKEEEQSDHLEERQDNEDEMITEDDEKPSAKQEHEEVDGMNEAVNPHVLKGALTVTDGAAEVLCPATAEEKLFACEFCGRNLMNSFELERHTMRHGI